MSAAGPVQQRAHAKGKVILLGEHAVVYGVPAIAAGIERGSWAEVQPALQASIRIDEYGVKAGDGSELERAFQELLASLGAPPLAVSAHLELPAGSGLGSSASLGVSVARAVLAHLASSEQARRSALTDSSRALAAAAAWEGVFHGQASGVDAAAVAHGGCIWFSKSEGVKPLRLAEPLTLAVALSGAPASTRMMVEQVAELRARRPEVVHKALEGVRSLVENARRCLESGDLQTLGQLMDLNQMILSGLFVSTEGIEEACRLARAAGALGAKLTGAGGGGAVIALVKDAAKPVLESWARAGLTCFETRVLCNRERETA